MTPKPSPIKYPEEVQYNPDPHIAQDYPGYPHLPSDKKSIKPQTNIEKKLAGITNKKHPKKTYGT